MINIKNPFLWLSSKCLQKNWVFFLALCFALSFTTYLKGLDNPAINTFILFTGTLNYYFKASFSKQREIFCNFPCTDHDFIKLNTWGVLVNTFVLFLITLFIRTVSGWLWGQSLKAPPIEYYLLTAIMFLFLYSFGLYLFARLMLSDRPRKGFMPVLEIFICSILLIASMFLLNIYAVSFIILMALAFGLFYSRLLQKRSRQKRERV